ncbi:unnamed protein product [Symbiodinium pilosum]|uniref:Claudin n=1 Tax=Symbiodinium pilosum TaxID=2952 RepID=A0A812VTM9_SYMPI|nr:unnamed protein product [Symbiodinium pilosum]
MTLTPLKTPIRDAAMALLAVIFLVMGAAFSIVALEAVWWEGALGSSSGLASVRGDLGLWTFVAHSDILGATFTSKPVYLNATTLCGGSESVVTIQEACSGIQATRALVGAAVAFSSVATLASLFSFGALLNCGGKCDDQLGKRLLLISSGLAITAAGLMIGAMIAGAVAGHGMGLGNFGTLTYAMGPGVYGAIFQIVICLLGAALATSAWNDLNHHHKVLRHMEAGSQV